MLSEESTILDKLFQHRCSVLDHSHLDKNFFFGTQQRDGVFTTREEPPICSMEYDCS